MSRTFRNRKYTYKQFIDKIDKETCQHFHSSSYLGTNKGLVKYYTDSDKSITNYYLATFNYQKNVKKLNNRISLNEGLDDAYHIQEVEYIDEYNKVFNDIIQEYVDKELERKNIIICLLNSIIDMSDKYWADKLTIIINKLNNKTTVFELGESFIVEFIDRDIMFNAYYEDVEYNYIGNYGDWIEWYYLTKCFKSDVEYYTQIFDILNFVKNDCFFDKKTIDIFEDLLCYINDNKSLIKYNSFIGRYITMFPNINDFGIVKKEQTE